MWRGVTAVFCCARSVWLVSQPAPATIHPASNITLKHYKCTLHDLVGEASLTALRDDRYFPYSRTARTRGKPLVPGSKLFFSLSLSHCTKSVALSSQTPPGSKIGICQRHSAGNIFFPAQSRLRNEIGLILRLTRCVPDAMHNTFLSPSYPPPFWTA
jgi:hypothetical protein